MAAPLTFTPLPVDHKKELQKRLEAAPVEHGEALLVLWDLLQTAHDQGILDLLDGMVSAKDTIAITIAKYAKTPEGITAIRNLLAAVKILGSVEPELLDHVSAALVSATAEHKREAKPPSLFALARRATSADSRRGLSFVTLILSELGKYLK
jgi:uncharacterized protein YjgD (DUF1641 family)